MRGRSGVGATKGQAMRNQNEPDSGECATHRSPPLFGMALRTLCGVALVGSCALTLPARADIPPEPWEAEYWTRIAIADRCTLENAAQGGDECIEVEFRPFLEDECLSYLVSNGFCVRCAGRYTNYPATIYCRPRRAQRLTTDWRAQCGPPTSQSPRKMNQGKDVAPCKCNPTDPQCDCSIDLAPGLVVPVQVKSKAQPTAPLCSSPATTASCRCGPSALARSLTLVVGRSPGSALPARVEARGSLPRKGVGGQTMGWMSVRKAGRAWGWLGSGPRQRHVLASAERTLDGCRAPYSENQERIAGAFHVGDSRIAALLANP